MIRKLVLFSYSLLTSTVIFSQYYQYSLYDFANQRTNPGSISQSDYATASFIYRSQQSLADVELTTFMFSAKYPLISRNGGNRWSALGISFSKDKAGLEGIFETNELGITYALNFAVGKNSMLSFGNRITYQSKRINIENLFTGNQFIPGLGFDGSLNSGENINTEGINFYTVSSGLSWEKNDKKGVRLAHLGASIFNFNTPNESLLGEDSPLPVSTVYEGGLLLLKKNDLYVYPEFLYTRSQGTNNLNIGAVTGYLLDKFDSRLSGQVLLLHTKYLLNEGILIGIQWKRGPLSVGTSYDIPLNNRIANRGAFELGVELGALIKSKYKAKKVKRRRTKKRKRNNKERETVSNEHFKEEAQSNEESTKVESNETQIKGMDALNNELMSTANSQTIDDIEVENENMEEAKVKARTGDFKNIKTNEPIYFNFNFKTNEARLSREDEAILIDLVIFMKENPETRVDITGHTDNIGDSIYNYKLSRKRAQSVARFLNKNGIERIRIKHVGFGAERPIVANTTDENRARNRRVEFVLYESDPK